MTGEELLYAVRYECGLRGLRLELRTTSPPLIERRCWGGWKRPRRIYGASLSHGYGLYGLYGSMCSYDVRQLLWDVRRVVRRLPVTERPTLTITKTTPWRNMLTGEIADRVS